MISGDLVQQMYLSGWIRGAMLKDNTFGRIGAHSLIHADFNVYLRCGHAELFGASVLQEGLG